MHKQPEWERKVLSLQNKLHTNHRLFRGFQVLHESKSNKDKLNWKLCLIKFSHLKWTEESYYVYWLRIHWIGFSHQCVAYPYLHQMSISPSAYRLYIKHNLHRISRVVPIGLQTNRNNKSNLFLFPIKP